MWMLVPMSYENQEQVTSSRMFIGTFSYLEDASSWICKKGFVGIAVGSEVTFFYIPSTERVLPEGMSVRYRIKEIANPFVLDETFT